MEKLLRGKSDLHLMNRWAMISWTIIGVLFTVSYGVKGLMGAGSPIAIALIVLFQIIPISSCWVTYRRDKESLKIQKVIPFAYGFSLWVILFIAETPIVCLYAMPMIVILMVYNNFKIVMRTGCFLCFENIAVLLWNNYYTKMWGLRLDQAAIYVIANVFIVIFAIISVYIASNINERRLRAVSDEKEKVTTTIDKVKKTSASVVEGVNTVKTLSDTNMAGAENVVHSMASLMQNNAILTQRTQSSLNMTNQIDKQVDNVSSSVQEMVGLSEQSMSNAKTSAEQLTDVVASTKEMAEISLVVEDILKEFKEEFRKVQEETGTISAITNQTNLLSLNASIEAARAGDAGKGFAVVADEIHNLSEGTKDSSERIMRALETLQETSDKMTRSIAKTVEIINQTLSKISKTNENVSQITEDTLQLGGNIHAVELAMNEVKESNKKLVGNMNQVKDVMSKTTENIQNANDTAVAMKDKFEETSSNVNHIKEVVANLVSELE